LKIVNRLRESPGLGFDALGAIVTVRAALEEAARTALATHEVIDFIDVRRRTRVTDRLEELLSTRETTGLPGGTKAMIGNAVSSLDLPIDEGAAKDLYSYLSTVSHPEGLSRDVFRKRGFGDTYLLTTRAAKANLSSAFVAWQAALAISAAAATGAWRKLESTLSEEIKRERLDITQGALHVPFESGFDVSTGTPVRSWVEGIWHYWEPDGRRDLRDSHP
jgi:hypothetical protein